MDLHRLGKGTGKRLRGRLLLDCVHFDVAEQRVCLYDCSGLCWDISKLWDISEC